MALALATAGEVGSTGEGGSTTHSAPSGGVATCPPVGCNGARAAVQATAVRQAPAQGLHPRRRRHVVLGILEKFPSHASVGRVPEVCWFNNSIPFSTGGATPRFGEGPSVPRARVGASLRVTKPWP